MIRSRTNERGQPATTTPPMSPSIISFFFNFILTFFVLGKNVSKMNLHDFPRDSTAHGRLPFWYFFSSANSTNYCHAHTNHYPPCCAALFFVSNSRFKSWRAVFAAAAAAPHIVQLSRWRRRRFLLPFLTGNTKYKISLANWNNDGEVGFY